MTPPYSSTGPDHCPPPAPPFREDDVLTASGLRGAFAAVRSRQRRHLATVHGVWGVLEGLTARAASWDAEGRPCAVVDPGAAVDASGHLRVLDRPADVGPPPHGAGLWRLVLAVPEGDGPPAPRWVPGSDDDGLDGDGLAIELARWRPCEDLDGSARPWAWRPGARATPRVDAAVVGRGAPVVASDDGSGWSVRVDTSASRFVGGVVYIVAPQAPFPPQAAGAVWSVKTSRDDGFVFEAGRWPLGPDDHDDKGNPTLPGALVWVGVETGRDRSFPPPPLPPLAGSTPEGPSAMNGPTPPAPAINDPSTPGPAAKLGDRFFLPDPPLFAPHARLKADELTGAVAFLDAVQTMHNRLMHDWGVVAGLGVSAGAGPNGRPVRVEPGLAVDDTGRELLLDTSYTIEPPPEAEGRAGAGRPSEWSLVLHAPAAPDVRRGVLSWRDPLARSGPRALRQGLDVVLARVSFRAGKLDGIDPGERRPVRPAAAPRVSAGTTGAGLTVWAGWYGVQPPPKGATPLGVFTRVVTDGTGPPVLAQLAGSRFEPISGRVLSGPSFVSDPGPGGFDFVVLFPDGPECWGVTSADGLGRLLDELKDPLRWSVSWVAVTPGS